MRLVCWPVFEGTLVPKPPEEWLPRSVFPTSQPTLSNKKETGCLVDRTPTLETTFVEESQQDMRAPVERAGWHVGTLTCLF